MKRGTGLLLMVVLVAVVARLIVGVGRVAFAEDAPSSSLSFVVLKDFNGKPIRNAAVVLHPVNTHGKQQRGGFELKTDGEGKTHFEGVPYGKMRVQVLAPGFQTFGEDYDVESPTMEITVKLKLPQNQYSIYSDHPDQQKPDDSKKDAPEKK
jgi:Carboxypeptidase regulatory-like domain